MINTSLPAVSTFANRFAATAPPAANPAPPAPPADEEPRDITIRQAFEGLASAVVVAGIETVGNTASSIVRAPQALVYSYKALWNTEQIGPILKTAIACVLPPCALAAPILTAIGSAGFGIFRGFDEGAHHGIGKAVEQAGKDVKQFHTEMAGGLIETIQEYEATPLAPGAKPYDIRVLEAGKGLVGGVVAGVVEGASVGAITLVRTPQGVAKAFSEIWTSDQGPVLKTCESLLVPAAAVLAAPLGLVGGAVFGIVTGFRDGYTKGVGEAIHNSGDVVKKYNDMTRDALK